jgi:hypothetical protein
MKKLFSFLAPTMLFAAADVGSTQGETPTAKSIVPAKYAGKYKNGGSDALAEFIKSQCDGASGFEFIAFFQLARANALPEDKVKMYETAVANKERGAQGRARMTLRNMLAPLARKNGVLKSISGEDVTVVMPELASRKPADAVPAPTEQPDSE